MIKIRISYEDERDAVLIVEALEKVLDIAGRPRASLQGQYKKIYIDAIIKEQESSETGD